MFGLREDDIENEELTLHIDRIGIQFYESTTE
jgi:hypothetical protein